MLSFEEIIGNLLLRHNCVVIPDFGGFVAKQSTARIDVENGIVHPPKKSILFNRQLINNDGLMINEYAQQQNITFDQAQIEIKAITSSWLKELHNGRRVNVEKVGYLFQDEERNICFEQDRHFNLLLSSFGLGQVHFIAQEDVEIVKRKMAIETAIPAATLTFAPEIEVEDEMEEFIQNPFVEQNSVRRSFPIWKYVAAAAAVPIIFYSIWIPMKTDVLESNLISTKDFNPFNKIVATKYEANTTKLIVPKAEFISLEEQMKDVKSEKTATFSYALTADAFVLVNMKEQDAIVAIQETTVNLSETNYIVGCFSDENNAKVLVNDLKKLGFPSSKILDLKKGLYRVTIGGTNSSTEMEQWISKAKAAGFDGWVLK